MKVLAELGVDTAGAIALGALTPIERAALVSSDTEGLRPMDLEVMLDRGAGGARRILERGRRRYVKAYIAAREAAGGPERRGPIAERVREVAQIALMGGERPS